MMMNMSKIMWYYRSEPFTTVFKLKNTALKIVIFGRPLKKSWGAICSLSTEDLN